MDPQEVVTRLSRTVGVVVHRVLEERSMSGNQLAKAAGLEQTGVARKLRGDGVFTLDDLAAIAPVLDVTIHDLIAWAQNSPRYSDRVQILPSLNVGTDGSISPPTATPRA